MSRRTEFEFLGRVTIGQYLPTGSALHRLDPRTKLLVCLLLIAVVVASQSLLGIMLLLGAVLIGLALARIPLSFALSGLRAMLPYLLLLALLQTFAIPQYAANATVLWRWAMLTITDRSILAGILLIARFSVMVLGLSLFSFSTTTTELTHGIEHLLRPWQKLGLPAHELALTVNIALRFVPIIAEEAERLMKAQASRGADFGQGRNFIQRTRKLLPLLVPLFLVSLHRADNLIEAMEARCYLGGKGRTHLIHLQAHAADYLALAAAFALMALVIGLSTANADQLLWRLLSTYL
ncbi:MAG: energy-coupling factor transporter transmembrane protein EcfT [Chloroflexi bacterium]|nr:energy-coupling factor transporter transmembrane protein EcfT [Chloroflexota bacterium]